MELEPAIELRFDQPYVGVRTDVTMATIGDVLPPLAGAVFTWLGHKGVTAMGPPFWKYNVIDMAGRLEVEVGVPVTETPTGEGRFRAGILPGGRYATTVHIGHPSALVDVTAALLRWAEEHGVAWDMTEAADGEHWGCRLEEYLTNPAVVPDMDKWETRLAFRLRE